MTYDPNTPANAQENIDVSQPKVTTNFQQLNTLFAIDHYAYNDSTASLRGKHKAVRLVEQAADPSTAADELAVYSKEISGATEIVWRAPSDGTVYQMTSAGALFTGIKPVAAVNWQDANLPTLGSQLNVASVSLATVSGREIYTITFTSALSTANIFWSVQGFASSGACYGRVAQGSYATRVNTSQIQVEFVDGSNNPVNPIGASVVIWEAQ